MMHWRVFLLCVFLLALPTMAQSQTAPASFALRNARHQILPTEIQLAYAGPDKRVWLVAPAPNDLPAVKAEIEAQWSRPMPLLHGARPALFEKKGRVWFITTDGTRLLAYDGKSWLEHAARSVPARFRPSRFLGDDPGHGRSVTTPVNLDLGTVQLFVESSGVWAYDGTTWSFQMISEQATGPVALLAEPSGKAAIIVQSGPPHIWRYAGGTFTPLPCNLKESIQSLALTPDNMLLLQTHSQGITPYVVGDGAAPLSLEAQFNQYLNKIDNVDPVIADAAAQSIANLGPSARPLIEKVLENIVDRDAERRLQGALRQIKDNVAPKLTFTLANPDFPAALDLNACGPSLVNDVTGRAYASFINIPVAAPVPAGLYAMDKDGAKRLALGLSRFSLYSPAPVPFPADGGKSLWIQNSGVLQRLDLTANPVTATSFPDPNFNYIQAIAADGTMFLSYAAPLDTESTPHLPVLAWKPTAPDERKILRAQTVKIDESFAVVAPDGALWTCLADKGVARTEDGKQWLPRLGAHYQGTQIFPGKTGTALIWQGKEFSLLLEQEKILTSNLDALLRQNHKVIADVFASPQPALFRRTSLRYLNGDDPGLPHEGGWSIAVDKEQRLWLTLNRSLRVLDMDQWQSVPWPDASPGPSMVMPVGDGSAMYVWAMGAHNDSDKMHAYLATFKDGKVQLAAAPHASQILADADRNLWLVGQGPHVQGEARYRSKVDRLGVKGVIDSFELPSDPACFDRSGFAWLDADHDVIPLCKDGKVVGRVTVPGAERSSIMSDTPGSVWVWTLAGLHHLTAAPGSPEYTLQAVYYVESDQGTAFRVYPDGDTGVSPKGFLFTTVFDGINTGRKPRLLHTVTLPKP